MTCFCCLSDVIERNPFGLRTYNRCYNCGFTFSANVSHEKLLDKISQHYERKDPHKKISNSKTLFYNFALNYLRTQKKTDGKKILDIGCGFGYFIAMALQTGWEPIGIEIVEDAVDASRRKIGYENVFHGELKAADLKEESFDAITLWDVLAIIDKPNDELKECFRLLKKGGIIGIRTRNVWFQMVVYRFFCLINKMALRFELKEPYVFNKYCFSDRSLYALLSRLGFINIKPTNSPLTSGDPYNYLPNHYAVKLAKICANIFSKFIYWMTQGRRLIGPSLLIWAEKP